MRLHLRQQSRPAAHVVSESPIGSNEIIILVAELLIPGRGDPIPNGFMAVKAGKIERVGPFNDLPPKHQNITPAHVQVLMPGLWDCHVHYTGMDVVETSYLPGTNTMVGAVIVEDLKRTLMAGYTTVRELGGHGGDLWPLVQKGIILGPNIYSAIAPLSITGGHGDDHRAPLLTILEAMNHGGAAIGICDGVDDCIKTVRKMIRRGARVIKVCSTGGVISLNDDPEDRQFSDAELKAMVEEAACSGRAVAAHAIGKAGIMAALRAGVKSIEHGMYLDKEAAEVMKKQGTIFVGTQHIVRTFEKDPPNLPPSKRHELPPLIELSKSSYRVALQEGVKIAFGTDSESSDCASGLAHGNNAKEIAYAVELGMSPLQAIESATANGPETLGALAPLSGQLKAGYDADFIVVNENPLEDIHVLTDPKNITHVWKAGKLLKSLPKE